MTAGESALEFGTSKCVCPKCGTMTAHQERGVPCTDLRCRACGSQMVGERCADSAATGQAGGLQTDCTPKRRRVR